MIHHQLKAGIKRMVQIKYPSIESISDLSLDYMYPVTRPISQHQTLPPLSLYHLFPLQLELVHYDDHLYEKVQDQEAEVVNLSKLYDGEERFVPL